MHSMLGTSICYVAWLQSNVAMSTLSLVPRLSFSGDEAKATLYLGIFVWLALFTHIHMHT